MLWERSEQRWLTSVASRRTRVPRGLQGGCLQQRHTPRTAEPESDAGREMRWMSAVDAVDPGLKTQVILSSIFDLMGPDTCSTGPETVPPGLAGNIRSRVSVRTLLIVRYM